MQKLEDKKVSSVGKIEPTPWFQMRQARRNFQFPLHGLWCPPALIVSKSGHLQWLHLMIEGEYLPEKRRTSLRELAVKVITPPESTIVVEYADFIAGGPPEGIDTEIRHGQSYPHGAIRDWTYADLAEREGELLCLYRPAQQEFRESNKTSLPRRFCELYKQLMHPAFRDYINTLAETFSQALDSNRNDPNE